MAAASVRARRLAPPREPDYETIRGRALLDRKGQCVKLVRIVSLDGSIVDWVVRWSREGRSDQFDLCVAGKVVFTGGTKQVGLLLGRKLCGLNNA